MIADLDTSLSPEPGEDKTAQKAEISRGRREFRQHLPALRERFPLVFPEDITERVNDYETGAGSI